MHQIPIPAGMETAFFVLGKQVLPELPELLECAFPGKTFCLIADENTWRAAGHQAAGHLEKAGIPMIRPVIFPAEPGLHPDYAISQQMAADFNDTVIPVAVGSGVLNDLVKCAAGIAGVPYACVATAASVDGYTAYGGAMSVDGKKITVPCPAPYALLADTDVLAAAPPAMLASGYADLMAKIPGGADWLLAAELGIDPVNEPIWNMVQQDLRTWLADPTDLNHIFTGLAATGFAMQLYRDSRPASGAEHLLSHVWEMEGLAVDGQSVSHGFKVGIGSVAVVQLMDFLIRTPVETARRMAQPLPTRTEREDQIRKLLKKGCYGSGIPETAMAKFQDGDAALARQQAIFDKWPVLQQKLRRQLFPEDEMISLLRRAGAPVEYTAIGLDREQYLHGIRTAQLIRRRYTILDLLYESGLLEPAIQTLR